MYESAYYRRLRAEKKRDYEAFKLTEYKCPCGSKVLQKNKYVHYKSAKHIEWSNKNKPYK